jgi:hypothetical protein
MLSALNLQSESYFRVLLKAGNEFPDYKIKK